MAGRVHRYAQGMGGNSATIVEYEESQAPVFGVLKPYAGGAAGLGLAVGTGLSLQAGARFAAVLYDANPFLGVALYSQDAEHPGKAPSCWDNGDGTITDRATKLMWSKSDSARTGEGP